MKIPVLASGLSLFVLTACAFFSQTFSPSEPTHTVEPLVSTATKSYTIPPTFESTATWTATAEPTRAPHPSPTPTPRSLTWLLEEIPAPSLKHNLLGEPEQQLVHVFLPPSYSDSNLHYPVVYFLPGYGSEIDGKPQFYSLDELAALIAAHQLSEMILVVPNGANALHGSFYVNSPVTGNWEDFITQDVVGYIDSNYRTIPAAEGRGIGGHSMGGFGAFNLAMRHPQIFAASYSLSSAFFDEQGLSASMMFDKERKPYRFLDELSKLSTLPEEEAIDAMTRFDGPIGFTMAYGAAFAPNPDFGPPFFDYPYELVNGEAKIIPLVWERWEDGLGSWKEKISEYHDNLAQLRGIVIDYGTEDKYPWIPPGSEYLSARLSEAGIQNQIHQFEGNHGDQLSERLIEVMLPFFDRVLVDARGS